MPIILIPLGMVMFILAIVRFLRKRKAKRLDCQQPMAYVSDFSASEYMGRMELVGIEIMEEAKKKPKYQIVLWLALDGLRLNEDGTSEWIRRGGEKKKVHSQNNELCGFNSTAKLYDGPMTMQASILQSQMQTLIYQQQQAAQAAMLISAFRPQYLYCLPYYQQQMQQTCCYNLYGLCQTQQGGMF